MEGLLDVLAMHDGGAVAISSCGNLFSFFHINIIKKIFSIIIICFDNDIVGLKKTLILSSFFLQHNVVSYLACIVFKDPGEALKQSHLNLLRNQLKVSFNFLENIIYRIYFHTHKGSTYRKKYVDSLLKIINYIQNNMVKKKYLKKINIILKEINFRILKKDIFNKACYHSTMSSLQHLAVNYLDMFVFRVFFYNIEILMKTYFIKIMLNFVSFGLKLFLIEYTRLIIIKKHHKMTIKKNLIILILKNKKTFQYFFYFKYYFTHFKYYDTTNILNKLEKKIYCSSVENKLLYLAKYLLK